MTFYWLVFVRYPSHWRASRPDGSYIKYIEWMGIMADCSDIGSVRYILHGPN